MGGLFRQAYPDLVLLCTLGGEEGEDGHNGEEDDNAELYIRVCGEALYHERLVITDIDIRLAVELDTHDMPLAHPHLGEACHLGYAVGVVIV